jgi:hypothetical protein
MAIKPLTNEQAKRHVFFDNMWQNFTMSDWGKVSKPIKQVSELYDSLFGQTVFIIGAGPSLDKNLEEFVNTYSPTDGIVIATDGAIRDLHALGFRPDYFITSEADGKHTRSDVPTTEDLLNDEVLNFFRFVPLIATTWANKKFIERWQGGIFWYINHHPDYQHHYIENQQRFPEQAFWTLIEPKLHMVGFHAIEVAHYLTAKRVVLLGCDCSATNDNHHSKHFNMDWDSAKIDLGEHYGKVFSIFLNEHYGDFGIETINCTEGGVITEDLTTAKCLTLKEFFHYLRSNNGKQQ